MEGLEKCEEQKFLVRLRYTQVVTFSFQKRVLPQGISTLDAIIRNWYLPSAYD